MTLIILAGGVAMLVSLLGTPAPNACIARATSKSGSVSAR